MLIKIQLMRLLAVLHPNVILQNRRVQQMQKPFCRVFIFILSYTFRIGVAMKKSSALQRCAVHGAATNGTTECETEVTYNKGRQAVVRMLGTVKLIKK